MKLVSLSLLVSAFCSVALAENTATTVTNSTEMKKAEVSAKAGEMKDAAHAKVEAGKTAIHHKKKAAHDKMNGKMHDAKGAIPATGDVAKDALTTPVAPTSEMPK